MDELLERAQRASQRLHGMTIRGEGWSGDARRGFIFNPAPVLGESGEGAGGFTGACCIGEACSILSAADCAAAGGVYQGDFTPCFPNPCAPPLPPCNGCDAFPAFDGSDRHFLRMDYSCTIESVQHQNGCDDPGYCSDGIFQTRTIHYEAAAYADYDPDTCVLTDHGGTGDDGSVSTETVVCDRIPPDTTCPDHTDAVFFNLSTVCSCGLCTGIPVITETITATEHYIRYDYPGPDVTGYFESIRTLSDECQP
jgi:hypothetical protein